MSISTTLSTETRHKSLVDGLHEVFKAKNADYGNSFGKSFEKYGIIAAMVRMEDKWNRLDNLVNGHHDTKVGESVRDTLLDLANYCILTVMSLDEAEERNNTREMAAEVWR